jgi:hypothetical protein
VKQRIYFLFLIGLFLYLNCSKQTLSRNEVASPEIESPKGSEETYLKARSKWTIELNSSGGGAGSSFILPLLSGARHGSDFPLIVTATLMNDQVIEAGLAYYENAVGMTPEQVDSFRQTYRRQNEVDQYFLVEVSLQTKMAENYLNLNRWTIFIEDDAGNQNAPAKIVEMPGSSQIMEGMMEDPVQKRSIPFDLTRHRKTVFLYFPRKDYYGNPVLHKNLKALKLVFLLEKGGSGRGEGNWIFN